MEYRLVDAKYVRDFVVWVSFSDGVKGEIDLKPELYGPIFEPLLDVAVFKRFRINPELHTLVWENGADFAPEFLHDKVREERLTTRSTGHT